MKRRRLVLFASVAFVAAVMFWLSVGRESTDAVRVQFIGMTNDPSLGRAALFCVTNEAVSLVICAKLTTQVHSPSGWMDVAKRTSSGLGYLERGESLMFAVPVPLHPEPWRVPVLWQRQELSRFEEFVNGQRGRLLDLFGIPYVHRDAWVPFPHVVYSPEVAQ